MDDGATGVAHGYGIQSASLSPQPHRSTMTANTNFFGAGEKKKKEKQQSKSNHATTEEEKKKKKVVVVVVTSPPPSVNPSLAVQAPQLTAIGASAKAVTDTGMTNTTKKSKMLWPKTKKDAINQGYNWGTCSI